MYSRCVFCATSPPASHPSRSASAIRSFCTGQPATSAALIPQGFHDLRVTWLIMGKDGKRWQKETERDENRSFTRAETSARPPRQRATQAGVRPPFGRSGKPIIHVNSAVSKAPVPVPSPLSLPPPTQTHTSVCKRKGNQQPAKQEQCVATRD